MSESYAGSGHDMEHYSSWIELLYANTGLKCINSSVCQIWQWLQITECNRCRVYILLYNKLFRLSYLVGQQDCAQIRITAHLTHL